MRSGKKKSSSGRRRGRKKGVGSSPEDTPADVAEHPPRAGLPSEDSVVSEKTLKSPKGKVYRILVTDQMDAYDKPERPETKRRRKP